MTSATYFHPFNLRPVVDKSALWATLSTAYASYCYIRRQPDTDRYGPMPQEWATRGDLVATGRVHPAQTPAWARSGPKIWKDADSSVFPHHLHEAVAFHVVLALPSGDDPSEWHQPIGTFCIERFANYGMIADWAIHYNPD